ncbi:hypothetical protein DL98DRAFT_586459 [Cadophora sp. DSE1049]|nr:hypothetical protein DL98DRAFT_586459 [Cadophora sp. DSE1049]
MSSVPSSTSPLPSPPRSARAQLTTQSVPSSLPVRSQPLSSLHKYALLTFHGFQGMLIITPIPGISTRALFHLLGPLTNHNSETARDGFQVPFLCAFTPQLGISSFER